MRAFDLDDEHGALLAASVIDDRPNQWGELPRSVASSMSSRAWHVFCVRERSFDGESHAHL